MNLILIAVISLGAIALVLAAVLLRNLPCTKTHELPRYPKCCLRLTAVDVVIRVAADLPMLASKPVRWKVSFVRWVDNL